jgi:transposase
MNKKIVAQNERVTIGADVHVRTHVVTAKVGKEIVDRRILAPSRGGWRSYLERFPGCEMDVIYESGPQGYNLYDWLTEMEKKEEQTVRVHIAPPGNVPKAPGKKRMKTDRRDSLALIHAYQSGAFEPVIVPEKDTRAERELVRTKEQLSEDVTRYKNRIHSMLKFHGIELETGKAFSDEWWKEALNKAKSSDPTGEIAAAMKLKFKMLKQTQEALDCVKARIKKLFSKGTRSDLAKRICKQVGIGIESAMVIATEVADFHAFKNSDSFASYIGVVPGAHNSGETFRPGPITKEGNPRLRHVFVECAWTWVRHDKNAGRMFAALKGRRGAGRAIVAMARRLAVIVYHLALHPAQAC